MKAYLSHFGFYKCVYFLILDMRVRLDRFLLNLWVFVVILNVWEICSDIMAARKRSTKVHLFPLFLSPR